ncbi:MAG: sugar phosphate isomerase/epimerase family protein [Candidatus Ratteibacteria bacterium]
MAAYTNFTSDLASPAKEVPLVDMQIMYVGELARITSELGGNLVRIFTGYEVPGVPFYQQWEQCVKAVRECCDIAAQYGITIGIQNHHDIAVHTDSLIEFLSDVDRPNVKIMFDAWSPAIRKENIEIMLEKVIDKMVYTTVADYINLPRFHYKPDLINYESCKQDLIRAVPLGQGIIDYDSFFTKLKKLGYNGWVAYEICSPLRKGGSLENLDYCAKKFVEYMKKYI